MKNLNSRASRLKKRNIANLKFKILNCALVEVSREYIKFEKLESYLKSISITNDDLYVFNIERD